MTNKDTIELLEKDIARLQRIVARLKHIEELENFKKHMLDSFNEACENPSGTGVADFFSLDFTITFNGKSVTVANYADTFEQVEYLLQIEIDDLKEEL